MRKMLTPKPLNDWQLICHFGLVASKNWRARLFHRYRSVQSGSALPQAAPQGAGEWPYQIIQEGPLGGNDRHVGGHPGAERDAGGQRFATDRNTSKIVGLVGGRILEA